VPSQAINRWKDELTSRGIEGLKVLVRAQSVPDYCQDAFLRESISEIDYRLNLDAEGQVWDLPVGMLDFLHGPEYLDLPNMLTPYVWSDVIAVNNGTRVEAVLTGAIGVFKTSIALVSIAYQVYLLSMFREPREVFDIAPTDELVFIIQSVQKTLAREVDYQRLRNMCERCDWFTNEFPFDQNYRSTLYFPKGITVRPIAGNSTGALSQNVFGGLIDEINFMAVIEKSKANPEGGVYDQAQENYRTIARRRESRFMRKGWLPGMLFLVSSRKYPGQFTDQKEEEAKRNPRIYVYDKRVWEIKHPSVFTGDWMNVFVGDQSRRPRILAGDDKVSDTDEKLVLRVPEEYRHSFESDLYEALRDIGGVSTQAMHPFMPNVEAVAGCFGKTQSVLKTGETDFVQDTLVIKKKRIRNNDNEKWCRWAHVDLGLTNDSAGVACGYVEKFIRLKRTETEFEVMPVIVFDFILEVKPPPGGEIEFSKIRALFYKIRDLGLPLRWITYDSYQSQDSIQILRSRGFSTGISSIDAKTDPYDVTKTAFIDGRLFLPEHDKAQEEIRRLERNTRTGKIDHPLSFSKDCADAIAGVVYGLTTRRIIWSDHGVPPYEIPHSLREIKDGEEDGEKAA